MPHSVGLDRPKRVLPALACDSHMHIFDPRFAPSPHWTRTPPEATVATYRLLQQRIGTSRTVVVNDLLQAWCGSDAVMDRVLVANPGTLYGF